MPGSSSPAAHHSGAYRLSSGIGAYPPKAGKAPLVGLLAALLLVLAMVAGCKHTRPEQALRDTIAKMQEAGESGDIDALMDPIAEDFAGAEGMDRKEFRRYVTFSRMGNRNVGVSIGPIDVKLYGDRATANFVATITGGPGMLPTQVQAYDIETGWRLQGADWKLINAKWKPKL